MLEELKEIIKERDNAYKEFRDKYDKKCEEVNDKILKLLPYEGKFVVIKDDLFYTNPLYINVREVFKHGGDIIIRGYGFSSEFSKYVDSTWVDWSFMKSYKFNINDIESEISKIKIIDECKFNDAFDKMIKNMCNDHIQTLL